MENTGCKVYPCTSGVVIVKGKSSSVCWMRLKRCACWTWLWFLVVPPFLFISLMRAMIHNTDPCGFCPIHSHCIKYRYPNIGSYCYWSQILKRWVEVAFNTVLLIHIIFISLHSIFSFPFGLCSSINQANSVRSSLLIWSVTLSQSASFLLFSFFLTILSYRLSLLSSNFFP